MISGYTPAKDGAAPVYPPDLVPGLPTLAGDDKHKIKDKWDEKREKKLRTAYDEIMKDQYMSVAEVKACLSQLGYELDEKQCLSFLYTIDKNRDGRISWEEFRDGVKALVSRYAKNGTSKGKKDKDKKDKDKKDKDKDHKDKDKDHKDKDKKDKDKKDKDKKDKDKKDKKK